MTSTLQTTLLGIGLSICAAAFPTTYQPAATTTIQPTINNNYIANPQIGWQEAHTLKSPLLPETIAYRRSSYGWALQNPSENVYNFDAVDKDLQLAKDQGKQFSFRIYTMKGEGSGGHQVPNWVVDKGAKIMATGEPDYSNCTYQEEWSKFVNALKTKYDGNPNISFIDISGYGNFNEWSWNDQTQFDTNYGAPSSVDGQARKRLADIFIGGSSLNHQCIDNTGNKHIVSYNYAGFSKTQLVMPYAGIQQSTHYVFAHRQDVGFRFDCLGRAGSTTDIMTRVGDVINQLWSHVPIVYEFCGSSTFTPSMFSEADSLLKQSHGSVVHDNFDGIRNANDFIPLLKNIGYKYFLKSVSYPTQVAQSDDLNIQMAWQNVGYAPFYPQLGITPSLHLYLVDPNGQIAQDSQIPVNFSNWMPSVHIGSDPIPTQDFISAVKINSTISAGQYHLKVGIIVCQDLPTLSQCVPLNLAVNNVDSLGRYELGTIQIN